MLRDLKYGVNDNIIKRDSRHVIPVTSKGYKAISLPSARHVLALLARLGGRWVTRPMRVIGWAVFGVILAVLVYVGYGIFYMTVPVRTFRTDTGHAGVFEIGESKRELLGRLTGESFSPQPKPPECPTNWIEVSGMTDTERNCLLGTDVWIEGVSSLREHCPGLDMETTLQFNSDKLASVTTVCRHGK